MFFLLFQLFSQTTKIRWWWPISDGSRPENKFAHKPLTFWYWKKHFFFLPHLHHCWRWFAVSFIIIMERRKRRRVEFWWPNFMVAQPYTKTITHDMQVWSTTGSKMKLNIAIMYKQSFLINDLYVYIEHNNNHHHHNHHHRHHLYTMYHDHYENEQI